MNAVNVVAMKRRILILIGIIIALVAMLMTYSASGFTI
jgi:hypothetical protein